MSEDSDAGDGERTSAWMAKALTHAYRLTAQDQKALQELRAGTAMLIGIGGHRRGERILLWRERVTVGRDPGSLVLLPDSTVSRRHAEFTKVGDTYEVADLGSMNGTYVNDQPAQVAALADGDEIRFGGNLFLFVRGTR